MSVWLFDISSNFISTSISMSKGALELYCIVEAFFKQ